MVLNYVNEIAELHRRVRILASHPGRQDLVEYLWMIQFFGMSSGSIPCKNPGHRPLPAQASIPPPPLQQGVGDPVAQ